MLLLISMGTVHVYWAFGGVIGLDKALPTQDGKRLLDPGKLLTFLVALFLFGFASVAYLLNFSENFYESYVTNMGWGLAIIFLLRAIGDFNMVGIFKTIKETEFAKHDTKYFVPLCLFLGSAFAFLSYT